MSGSQLLTWAMGGMGAIVVVLLSAQLAKLKDLDVSFQRFRSEVAEFRGAVSQRCEAHKARLDRIEAELQDRRK